MMNAEDDAFWSLMVATRFVLLVMAIAILVAVVVTLSADDCARQLRCPERSRSYLTERACVCKEMPHDVGM